MARKKNKQARREVALRNRIIDAKRWRETNDVFWEDSAVSAETDVARLEARLPADVVTRVRGEAERIYNSLVRRCRE